MSIPGLYLYLIGHAALIMGLAGLGLWHAARRQPLLHYGNDAVLLMLGVIVVGGAAMLLTL